MKDVKNMILINSKALSALEGKLVPTSGNEEALLILEAMKLRGLDYDSEEVLRKTLKYHDNGVVKYMVTKRVYGDLHIALVLSTSECPLPDDLTTRSGVLAYVYNVDCEWESENGSILLEKEKMEISIESSKGGISYE